MTKLGLLLRQRKSANAAGTVVSRLVTETAEEIANQVARHFTATPMKPKPAEKSVQPVKVAESAEDEEAARRYRESRSVSGPVTPGEIAATSTIATGANWLAPRLQQHIPNERFKPEGLPHIPGAAWQTFGPDNVLPNMLIGSLGISTLMAPMADPLYHQGKRTYLKSVGEGMLGAAENMRQRSHEVRDRYGVAGVPIQALHGIMNPLQGLTYAGQSLGRFLGTKQGSELALRAEQQIKRATSEKDSIQ